MFQKHYWRHDKGRTEASLDDLQNGNLETMNEIINKEMGSRIAKSTKRNNAQTATDSPMCQGYKYGVPSEIKIAAVESLTTK